MSRSASVVAGAAFVLLAAFVAVSGVAGEQPAVKPVSANAAHGLGRVALPDEIKAWDTDVRFDGMGLPPGRGTVKQGDQLFQERCASCHGEFGEGAGRWPVLSGGQGTLTADRPDKTVGSLRLHGTGNALW
jgi:S-disulfanyl-L-cysteine oxidoreductase SoxD